MKNNNEESRSALLDVKDSYKWTGNTIELVELVSGLNKMDCVKNRGTSIHELVAFVGVLSDVDIRDCYSAYMDMKHRKNESCTYFLDKMRERLSKRMQQDDEKERQRK